MKRFTAVACVLILSIASLASADTKKGRGSVNKPMIVTWRGNGPTQITVQVKQAKQPLMLVLGDSTEDITWCTSVGHSTRDRVIRCDFNAVSDSYALAVGALSGSASFEVTVTSNPIGESRTLRQPSAGLEERARMALQRLARIESRRAAG